VSKAVPMKAREPRLTKSMAEMPWTSSQTRTQRPQRMHLSGSRRIEGLETSSSLVVFFPRYRRWRIPISMDRVWRSHLPLRAQYRQSSGWLLKSNSTLVRRASSTLGERVLIFMPGATGKEQAGVNVGEPSTSTTQRRQAPLGGSPSMWQSVGTWMPSRLSAVRIVSPSLAWIVRPSASNVIMLHLYPFSFGLTPVA